MSTANERTALWFLALVALSGSGVRLWRAKVPEMGAAESAALDRQLGRVDSVREFRRRPRAPRPSKPVADTATVPELGGQLLDLDRATADQIDALPGIGPALSKRIVAARDSIGGFGQIEALCGIAGIRASVLQRLRPLVTFTGGRRPLSDACGEASKRPRKTRVARSRQSR